MFRRGEKRGLSAVVTTLLIVLFVIVLAAIVWVVIRGNVKDQSDEVSLDKLTVNLRISNAKVVNDTHLNVTLKRGVGEGDIYGVYFVVHNVNNSEVARYNISMKELEEKKFEITLYVLNASEARKITLAPIIKLNSGKEVIGNINDEFLFNRDGSSGGSGSSGSGGSNGGGSTPTCKDTCNSLEYECGTHTICNEEKDCGKCDEGYVCNNSGKCVKDPTCVPTTCEKLERVCGEASDGCGGTLTCGVCDEGEECHTEGVCMDVPCTDTCSSLKYECGAPTICGKIDDCGKCDEGYACNSDWLCVAEQCVSETDAQFCSRLGKNCGSVTALDNCEISRTVLNCGSCNSPNTCGGGGTENVCGCTPTTCSALGRNCGTVSDGCGGTLTCGNYGGGCQTGYTCNSDGVCVAEQCVPEADAQFCLRLGKNCGSVTALNNCEILKTVNCGNCTSPLTCGGSGISNVCGCNPESDNTFCTRLNSQCGKTAGLNNCGELRIVSCGVCNDNNVCTTDSCSSNNKCVYTPVSCDDSNDCTTDICDPSTGCSHASLTGVSCKDDGNPCTTDICSNGLCTHIPISDCCTSDSQCGGGAFCPQDRCNLSNHKCYQSYPLCKHNDGCCPLGCNLGNDNDCTTCTMNSHCNDNNVCTTDRCVSGSCTFTPITQCINNDGCCPTGCNAVNDNNCNPSCGNGVREGSEQCDGLQLGGATCASVLGSGYTVGTVTCTSGCIYNVSNCCSPESNSAFCSRLTKQCGNVTALDNCGNSRTVSSCGTCQSGYTCSNGLCVQGCVPESNSAFCSRLGKNCGNVTGVDNCGNSKTVNCGSCSSPLTCGGGGTANVCGCTVSSYSPALNTFCGSRNVTTNCGTTVSRTGTLNCTSPNTCGGGGTANVCGCTVSSYSPALNTFCGSRNVTTNCGTTVSRTGTLNCTSPNTCGGGGTANVCGCTVSSYSPALNTFCGSRNVTTNCGTTVTRNGTLTCQTGYSCAANGTCVKSGGGSTPAGAIIIDHTTTNISKIPTSCINKVKSTLHIAYSHTSHGSQIYSGMQALQSKNSLYSMSFSVSSGKLHFEDYYGYGDQSGFATGGCYDLSACDNGGTGLLGPTRQFLNSARGSGINVIMWSWCSIAGHNIPFYLNTMQTAITEYPNVKFVFITGHAEGGGVGDSSDSRNEQIRNFVKTNTFCSTRQCILYDFADIENYDPDGNYFLNKRVWDNLDYNSGNWAVEYLARHPTGLNLELTNLVKGYGCAHSDTPSGAQLNCALKGQAAWYMFARMVGWDGVEGHECN